MQVNSYFREKNIRFFCFGVQIKSLTSRKISDERHTKMRIRHFEIKIRVNKIYEAPPFLGVPRMLEWPPHLMPGRPAVALPWHLFCLWISVTKIRFFILSARPFDIWASLRSSVTRSEAGEYVTLLALRFNNFRFEVGWPPFWMYSLPKPGVSRGSFQRFFTGVCLGRKKIGEKIGIFYLIY